MSEDPLTPGNHSSVSVSTEANPRADGTPPGDGNPRGNRRRRRRRRRGGRGGGPQGASGGGGFERTEELSASGPERPAEGVLFIPPRDNASGVLVSARTNYLPTPKDPLVPRDLIQRERLEAGALIAGIAADGGRPVLRRIDTVEGMDPGAFRQRPAFQELISIDPNSLLTLETTPDEMCGRVVDLLAPIGRGQRCLIVAPPKAGKTTLLKDIAHGINLNHPEVVLFVLLVDERPEEVTDFRRSVAKGEVVASSSDETAENHIQIAEVVLERARRLVEMKQDVVILCDSITRMSRAYNNEQRGSGKILSGGIDARTMEKPRRFFGAARNAEDWGSLTIIATALVDTGSRMDEVIFQEFKGTGNTEIVLDRGLFERRIFPAINIAQTGTRKEEKLLPPTVLPKTHTLRRALAGTDPLNAMKMLLERLQKFPSNDAFLKSF